MNWQMMGGLLLLITAITAVVHLRRCERYYLSALHCAVDVVRHAKRKIELFDSHTSDILMDFDVGDKISGKFVQKDTDFRSGVSAVTEYLRGQDKLTFLQFADHLGAGYREDTIKLCEYTLSRLVDSQQRAEKEYPARLKLYTALPILFVVSLFVLFM